MWLTEVLMAVRRVRSSRYTPGRLFIGKHRKYRPVTPNMVKNVVKRLAIEQENKSYLNTPYLTAEEERGHAKEQNFKEYKVIMDKRRHENMKPHRYLDEHFAHLKDSKLW